MKTHACARQLGLAALLAALTTLPCVAGEGPVASEVAVEVEEELSHKRRREFEAAFDVLEDSNEATELVAALEVLRRGIPDSRVILDEAMTSGSFRRRTFALKVLGENGDPAKDLPLVSKGLKDSHPTVRFAAVMAVRKLGPDGFAALTEYLAREKHHNNLKMAVKTFQHWGNKDAIPHLARLLKRERKATVRNFCMTALERLSGKKLGNDAEVWAQYVEQQRLQEQAKRLAGGRV